MDIELMTVEQVAKFFQQKNRKVIDNWLYTGALPRTLTVKIGNKLFFVKERLEKFIEQRCQIVGY